MPLKLNPVTLLLVPPAAAVPLTGPPVTLVPAVPVKLSATVPVLATVNPNPVLPPVMIVALMGVAVMVPMVGEPPTTMVKTSKVAVELVSDRL